MFNQQLLFIVMSIIGYGFGAFFYKMAGNQGMHPLMITMTVTCMYIAIMPFIYFAIPFDRHITNYGITLAVIGGVATGIGNLGWMYAMRHGEAGTATSLTALYPALTLLLSCLFLGEAFTLKKGIGITLSLIGLAILS